MLQMITLLLLERRSLTGVRDDSVRLLFRGLGARGQAKPTPGSQPQRLMQIVTPNVSEGSPCL